MNLGAGDGVEIESPTIQQTLKVTTQPAGTTAETSASIYCIKTSLGSTLVISSSSKYESTHGEAESIFNRILSIMQQ